MQSMTTRMAIIETKIENLVKSTEDLKNMLQKHVEESTLILDKLTAKSEVQYAPMISWTILKSTMATIGGVLLVYAITQIFLTK